MKQQVAKNNVSYFEAGFKAAMAIFLMPTQEVKRRFYETTTYPNLMRSALNDYDRAEDDTTGTEIMLKNL